MANISIIVPVYNDAINLERALLSLIKQSIRPHIIVIDDGSKDNPKQIVDKLNKTFGVEIEYHYQENKGIAYTRNKGLELVRTEYFGFLDSDDYFHFDFIRLMLNEIKNHQPDFISCDFYWVDNKERYRKDGPFKNSKEMLVNIFATLWNKVYRTDFIKGLDFKFPDGLKFEDASFIYKLCPYIKKHRYINHPLVYYVQRPGSITHSYKPYIQDMITIFDDLLSYYYTHNLHNEYFFELEYLTTRFFLGNNFIRASLIDDVSLRNDIISRSYTFLTKHFSNYKKNPYIKKISLKNFYFRLMNPSLFKYSVYLIRLIKRGKL